MTVHVDAGIKKLSLPQFFAMGPLTLRNGKVRASWNFVTLIRSPKTNVIV